METTIINTPFSEQELKKFKEALKEQKNTGYYLDLAENNQTESRVPLSLRFTFLNEECRKDYLKNILPEKDIQRNLDTLIGTQRVRRIGPEILQNNRSHTELPNLPEHLKPLLEKI